MQSILPVIKKQIKIRLIKGLCRGIRGTDIKRFKLRKLHFKNNLNYYLNQ